ncbi:MAG: CbrC family protein [bacterium]|nr:CbrC family protein [bacterium]
MISVTKTCQHCGREYTFYISGEPCGYKTNNESLCPECMAAVIAALSKIPVKYSKTWIDKTDLFDKEQIKKIITSGETFQLNCIKESENGFPITQKLITSEYNYCIDFYQDNHNFSLYYNDANDYYVMAHVYIDNETKEFNRFVEYLNKKETIISSYTLCRKPLKLSDMSVQKLAEPMGKIMFSDIRLTLDNPKKKNNKTLPKQITKLEKKGCWTKFLQEGLDKK